MASPASIHNIVAIIGAAAIVGACSGEPGTDDSGDTGTVGSCAREPLPADSPRYMVLAHPFDASGAGAGRFAVYRVDPSNPALQATGTEFEMRRAFLGEIVFTPDGRHGFVAHDDGTIGAFELAVDGSVTVLHEGFGADALYASGLAVDATGDTLWVTDGNWPDNGGGLYPVAIACDGTLTSEARAFETKNATRLSMAGGLALVGSRGIDGGNEADNAHLVDLGTGSVVGSAPAFPDDEASMSVALLSDDGAFGFIGDNSGFSTVPNRVAVVAVGTAGLTARTTIDIEDPVWMVASPFDDAVLVASGFENEILTLRREGDSYALAGVAASSPLPGAGVRLQRGSGQGLAFFAENQGVRALRFEGDGTVSEVGQWLVGSTSDAIVGAIGVQP